MKNTEETEDVKKVPDISVVVVAWKQDRLLKRCISAVLNERAADFSIELIVVSNGVGHSILGVLKSFARDLTHIRLRENSGFAAAANVGGRVAASDFLVFINDDAFPTDGALRRLWQSNKRSPGLIGSHISTPSGRTLECGADIRVDASCSPNFRDRDAQSVGLLGSFPARMVTGCCFGLPRIQWEVLEGFDENFFPAYFEDADLCLRARKHGFSVRVEASSLVYHDESTSASNVKGGYMSRGRSTFVQKWQNEPSTTNSAGFGRSDLLSARGLPDDTQVVLHVDDFYPSRTLGSGLPRMWNILEEAASYGVLVVSVASYQDIFADAIHVSLLGHIPLPSSPEEAIERFGHLFDSILVSRPHNFERVFLAARRYHPHLEITYDAESLFFDRVRKRIPLLAGADRLKGEIEMRTLLSQEEFIARTTDRFIAISPEEFRWFDDFGRQNGSLHRPWFRQVFQTGEANPSLSALFVAGWLGTDTPNSDALDYFAKAILPLVRAKIPDFTLRVTGDGPPDSASKSGIVFLGLVDDLSLEYQSVACAINPVRYGSGVKLKSIEALAHGCPLVTSSCGFEGLADLPWGAGVTQTDVAHEFASRICTLVADATENRSARVAAESFYTINAIRDSYWRKYLGRVSDDSVGMPTKDLLPEIRETAPPKVSSKELDAVDALARDRWRLFDLERASSMGEI